MRDNRMDIENEKSGSLIYISHGGGPWPLLGDPRHANLIEFLGKLPSNLINPSAILVVSGHWEEDLPAIQANSHPPMLFDYYGFPEESYKISYPAPGHPELAGRISTILEQHSIRSHLDPQRGYDHGVFVPLMLMYPEATLPCLQMSLVNNLDPKEHIQLGKALRELRHDNILIIGSGASFHNLRG
ncbi:MAG: DODA-type extradiol aromatic ring-opening family dioxygenase, partial [Desulforhopalus sp.]